MSGIYQFHEDDAFRFAHEQGIKVSQKGDELQFRSCPYCGQATTKKYKFAINLKSGAFNCLRASCGAKGNMLTLAKDFGFSLGRDADEYYQPIRKYRDVSRYPRPEVKSPAVKYMESRGISKAITERYAISTYRDQDNVIVFPFYDEHSKLQFIKYRKADFDPEKDSNKEWCAANCKPILFGMDQCDDSDTLILTEGQIDSLSVAEVGFRNAVSVPTGAKGFTWVPYCWDFLSKYKTLIVFGDHEHDHITLLDEMASRFRGTVKHVRPEDYQGCKDANELLQTHGKQAVIDAVVNAVPLKSPKIRKLSEVKRRSMADTERITTGIRALDRAFGGFQFGTLTVLTGKRGLGKSTLASQFGLMAIRDGYPTFFYSGEMTDWIFQEWFDRQCAGPDRVHREESTLGYVSYSVKDAYADQIHGWYDEKCYIYDNTIIRDGEEAESITDTMKAAIEQYGCRVLIVDNLMTAMDDDVSVDLYRQQTRFVNKLTEMAKAYNVLIILVAHPRKSNSDSFDNDDVSGSSNITNLATIVLNYGEPKKKKDEEQTEDAPDRVLTLSKNRINGRMAKVSLWFDEKSKRISENRKFDWLTGWESVGGFAQTDDLDEVPF